MNLLSRLTLKLVRWVCPEEFQESVIGDLLEQRQINLRRSGTIVSNLLFVYNGIKFIRLSVLRKKKNSTSNILPMLFNYLTVALRNLRKQKRYHLINFAGLTMGLSCCALALLYLDHELSYDNFHPDSQNTYRVTGELNDRTWFPSIMNQYAERVMNGEFPEIQRSTKFRRAPRNFAVHSERRADTRAIVTNLNSQFFEVFDFATLEGDKKRMLTEPSSAVLTKSTAERIFGEGPFLGKIFTWDTLSLHVTGVIEDLPSNTHLDFNLLISEDVPLVGVFTYITLHQGVDLKALEKKIRDIDTGDDRFYLSRVRLQSIESIHFADPLTFELKPPGNKNYLYLLSGIALFILIISCTNYMNLSAAIYAERTKEMAVRRVLGSSKKGLASQFLIESTLLTMMTLPAVLLIVHIILPQFVQLVDVPLENHFVSSLIHIAILIVVALLTGILAGIYPILTMTRFSPLVLFKGSGFLSIQGLNLRKVLLTLQFTVLLLLGTGAYYINKQLRFIQTKDLGISKTNIVKVSNIYDLYGTDKYAVVKSIALANPHIFGFTTGTPPGTESYGLPYKAEGHDERSDALMFAADLDYFEVLEVEGLKGDFFSNKVEDLPNVSLVVNEKFVELMGWDDPIGKKVTTNPATNPRDHFISGVFKNYHALSLHSEIVPQFIFARKTMRSGFENILVKIDMENTIASFEAIEDAWYSVMPDSPIICEFLDDDIQAAYGQEQKAGDLSLILSVLAIVLAVMGLVGLASYLAELRAKEVGIRKVLGASYNQILLLLNREFVLLISIATLISGSVGFYVVTKWLNTFAYRTTVEFLAFPLAGLIVFGVTFLTISIQSEKTARRNPAEVIHHE